MVMHLYMSIESRHNRENKGRNIEKTREPDKPHHYLMVAITIYSQSVTLNFVFNSVASRNFCEEVIQGNV